VRAVFPTPPSPSTTNLYSTILPAILAVCVWREVVLLLLLRLLLLLLLQWVVVLLLLLLWLDLCGCVCAVIGRGTRGVAARWHRELEGRLS